MSKRMQTTLLASSVGRKAVSLCALMALALAVAAYFVVTPVQAYADNDILISVYEQTGNQTPVLAGSYTKDAFEALQSDGNPISGLYYKGDTWYVTTAITYVTLDDLFASANVDWGSGDVVSWGGDAAQGKAKNTLSYETNDQLYFYPATTPAGTSLLNPVKAPMVLSITECTGSIVSGTAADVEEANIAKANGVNEVRAVLGSTESDYLATTGATSAGKRLWSNLDSVLLIHKGDLSKCAIAVIADQVFTGSAVEPELTVTDGDVELKAGTDYSVAYSNNTEVGTATVTITGMGNYEGEATATFQIVAPVAETQSMFRLYNPNSGEHFYTASSTECDNLVKLGWRNEGTGWIAPTSSNTPVYRLYNPNAGEHMFTTNASEKETLTAAGWNYEGVGWYSDDAQGVAVHRAYNPNAFSCNHNYTTSESEQSGLVALGWHDEGVAWYGVTA